MHDPDESADDRPPSKSARKREMHALRDLGARIADLPAAQREGLPVSEPLRRALAEYDRLRAREARRRHLSYLGRLLRTEDVDALGAALARLDASSAEATRTLHHLEHWRDALIADERAVGAWCDACPATDRPRLRQLVRAARTEAERADEPDAPKRAFRALFRFLREESSDAPPPPPSSGRS